MTKDPGRHGSAYWKARKIVLAGATHCAICRGALDFNAPPRSRWAPSVDHIISLSELKHYGPAERRRLGTDPSNMRPAHVSCNSSRGARAGNASRGRPARAAVNTIRRVPEVYNLNEIVAQMRAEGKLPDTGASTPTPKPPAPGVHPASVSILDAPPGATNY